MGSNKGKKRKGGDQSGGMSKRHEVGGSGSIHDMEDHRSRRRLSRKEERREKKRLKKFKLKTIREGRGVPDMQSTMQEETKTYTEIVEQKTRESFRRRQDLKNKLQLSQLKRAIEKEEEKLESWVPEEPADPLPKENKYKLKGAARPAEEVYPHLYPPKIGETAQPEDLLDRYQGELSSHVDTFQYVKLNLLLGLFLLAKGNTKAAIETFDRVTEMDTKSKLFDEIIRINRLAAYVEIGELAKAREIIEATQDKHAFMKWDKVLIEFISYHLLKEGDSDHALRNGVSEAFGDCSEVAEVLLAHEEFEADISPESILEDEARALDQYFDKCLECLNSGKHTNTSEKPCLEYTTSIEARYFHRSISWWRDADGIFDCLANLLPDEEDSSVRS